VARSRFPGVLAFALLAGICAFSLATSTPATDVTPQPTTAPASPSPLSDADRDTFDLFEKAKARLAHQAEIDAGLAAELASGAYSLENPLVVVDPYGASPLTAVVLFRTPSPSRISVHVAGDEALSAVEADLTGEATDHVVPVYGLYAGRANAVTLVSRDAQGNERTKVLEIATEPESQDLENILLRTELAQPERYEPGFNFPFELNSIKLAYDAYGKYRWVLKDWYLNPTNYGFHGHFIVAEGAILKGSSLLYEIDPLGRIYRVLYTPHGVNHEILTYKGDHLLVAGSSGDTVLDMICEISPDTGEILHTLDMKTVLQRSRIGMTIPGGPDWMHLNAIVEVEGTDDILVSSRAQSAVTRFAWPSGAIDWILAPPTGWSLILQKHLLTPVGSDFAYAYNQHAPSILPDQDGDPGTIDILLFDNGVQREAPSKYSRLVQFRIDERAGTVQQIWEFGKEAGLVLYSTWMGDADLLSNGTILGTFAVDGPAEMSAVVLEVDREQKIVWQSLATSRTADARLETYRTLRMSIYLPGTTETPISVPALNLIPKEVLAKYGGT